jgi:hypothetical protein
LKCIILTVMVESAKEYVGNKEKNSKREEKRFYQKG